MEKTLIERERWVIRRKSDGAIFCGLAQNYKFRQPEDIGQAAIKTYRSAKQALAAFDASWSDNLDVEAIKVVESVRYAK